MSAGQQGKALQMRRWMLALQYLWSGRGVSGMVLAGLAAPSAFAALVTDSNAVRLLAGMAILAAAVQFGLMHSVRHQGMKVI